VKGESTQPVKVRSKEVSVDLGLEAKTAIKIIKDAPRLIQKGRRP
jgi:hypothetical protein